MHQTGGVFRKQEVVELIRSGLNPGKPQEAGALTLVPLFGGLVAKEYVLAAEALADGTLQIGELDGGNVPQIAAVNQGQNPVLLLDGEHLQGAMQNRIVNTTVLLAPRAKTILPVACVEAGRWHVEADPRFSSTDVAYSRLRAKNAESIADDARRHGGRSVDQGEVWADIDLKHEEAGVSASRTAAMSDAYDIRRSELDEIRDAFGEPDAGQTGIIACLGGKPVALDSFDRPETLAKVWPGLISGYAMDSIGQRPRPLREEAVRAFLDNAAGGEVTAHAGVGLGTEVIVTSDRVVGHALAWEGGVVHVALFEKATSAEDWTAPGLAPPSRRRQIWS